MQFKNCADGEVLSTFKDVREELVNDIQNYWMVETHIPTIMFCVEFESDAKYGLTARRQLVAAVIPTTVEVKGIVEKNKNNINQNQTGQIYLTVRNMGQPNTYNFFASDLLGLTVGQPEPRSAILKFNETANVTVDFAGKEWIHGTSNIQVSV